MEIAEISDHRAFESEDFASSVYGLGTENQQLPSYITILPGEGERNYGSAFLPAIHQGTAIDDFAYRAV